MKVNGLGQQSMAEQRSGLFEWGFSNLGWGGGSIEPLQLIGYYSLHAHLCCSFTLR